MIADKSRHLEIFPLLHQLPSIQIESIVKKFCKELIEIDVNGFAGIISTRLPDITDEMINSLEDCIEKKFMLLSAFYQLDKEDKIENDKKDININGDSSVSRVNEVRTSKIELSESALESYLKLMCIFAPHKVLILTEMYFV